MKYKEMLKRKGDKDAYRVSTSGKSDQAGVVEKADEDSCDVLTVESGKNKYSDARLLDLKCTYHMCQKISTYKSYDGGSVLMGNDVVYKTIGISNIHMRMFDGQVRTLTNVQYVPDLRRIFSCWEHWKLEGTSFLVQIEESK